MSARALPGALLILAGLAAGCKSDRPAPGAASPPATPAESQTASQPTTVTVTATEYALDLPAQIPAGAITLHLVNQGKELHQAQIIRLEDGKTLDDFSQAMKQNGPPPSWVRFLGGPNGTAPGNASDATVVLTPGHYAVLCLIPGPTMVPHVMSGMIRPFEVTAATGASAAQLPVADDTIKMADYSFTPSQPLTAGHHTILVQNVGPQEHELVLLRIPPGKSVADFAKWSNSMKGPPPAVPIGGVTVMDNGTSSVFTADLTAGDYAFICFAPDAKDGKPHFAHGMMQGFKVS